MKTLRDLSLCDKRVLVRVDFNVPMDEQLHITDDIRIRTALPTIRYILENKGKLILCSHMGRPKGKRVEAFSLAPVGVYLQGLLGCPVRLAPDCVGEAVEAMVAGMEQGEVVLLENLRFHKEETDNDRGFAEKLARLAESMSTMLLPLRTGPTPRWSGLPIACRRRRPVFCCRQKWSISTNPWMRRSGLWLPWSGARRYRPSWGRSGTCSTGWIV